MKMYGFCLVRINRAMDLYEIRKKTAYDPNAKPTQKAAVRRWLTGLRDEFQFAVTLTLKQLMPVLTTRGAYVRKLRRADCDAIASRFVQKLNRQAFGKSAERHNKSLRYLAVVEGQRSAKNLHLHFAIGGLPSTYQLNEFPRMVKNSVDQVKELDVEHDVQIMDSGWTDYITKELGREDTDNVLWQLA